MISNSKNVRIRRFHHPSIHNFRLYLPEELSFLSHVNDCCKESKMKSAIQHGIVDGLSRNACEKLGEFLLNRNPLVTDGNRNTQDSGFLGLACDAEFVALLSERTVTIERQLGISLLKKSAEIAAAVEDSDHRDRVSRQLIMCALRSVPELAWDTCRDCRCDPIVFTQAAEIVLKALAHRKSGRRDCWVRCTVEHGVCYARVDAGEPPDREGIQRAFEATKISKDPLALEMNSGWRPSPEWYQGIIKAFQDYIVGVEENEWWMKHQLNKGMDHLASVDWPSFMTIARDSTIGRHAMHLVEHKRLHRPLLAIDAGPEDVLPDIECIRSALDRGIEDDSPVGELRDWLLAWSAANMPGVAAEIVANIPADRRIRLAANLEHLPLHRPWNAEQIRNVTKSFRECPAEANELSACARLLGGLASYLISTQIVAMIFTLQHTAAGIVVRSFVLQKSCDLCFRR